MIKNISWKKVLPHIIAIGIFLIIALIYCRQALSGEVLQQGDILHWKGAAQESFDYYAKHGNYPLWNTHLFSGMPNYQVQLGGHLFLLDFTSIFTLGLPQPISFFFLACICFYILTQVLSLRPIIGVLSSLAFAYATFNPIIIVAGHVTEMVAIAYMPAFLAGILLLYEKKYTIGVITATVFATCEIGSGHIQVNYYCFLCIGVMTIFYLIKWIKAGQIKHTIIALALAALSAAVAIGNAALVILPTYEYSKYTIRGGKGVSISDNGKATEGQKTSGLDESYAFQYSLGKSEAFTLAMPNAFGGATETMFDENSDVYNNAMQVYQQLNGKLPAQQAQMVVQSLVSQYWGGIQPFTAGPTFVGTLIVLLALLGWFVTKSKHRWWILTTTVFFIFLAWGGHFLPFNELMLKYFPLYNKFRAPNMTMVIPTMLLPLMAGIALNNLVYETDPQTFIKDNFKKILYVLGGFIALALIVYLGNDYSLDNNELKQFLLQPQVGASSALNALEAARKSLFLAGIGRLVLFSLFLIAGLYLYAKKIVKPFVIVVIFLAINTIDLLHIDSKYMNSNNYVQPEDLQSQTFTQTPADQMVLQDKDPHFRVLNLTFGDPFTDAITSYYHRSIGGYHAAKLSIYQDLIAVQLQNHLNPSVLDMLDTKYIIAPSQQGQQGQQGQAVVQKNPGALGAAWFVKQIVYVPDAVSELNSLTNFNPRDTAFVQSSEKSKIIAQPAFDSSATIHLINYDNDAIKYQTDAKSAQFAVLSEVYYPAGWNAYIDGKKADYVQTNYVLRGISVPAGHHEIDFKFEPRSIIMGQTIVYVANILFWLSIIISLFLIWKKRSHPESKG
ncbi:MAG TPA: YfhO family protein [Arachidicoccus sp.]